MNRRVLLGVDRARFVHRLADDVQDAAERFRADRHLNRRAGVRHFDAADQAFGRVHRDGAHDRLTEVLRDLEHEVVLLAGDVRIRDRERVQNLGQLARRELDVHDRSDDLRDLALAAGRAADRRHFRVGFLEALRRTWRPPSRECRALSGRARRVYHAHKSRASDSCGLGSVSLSAPTGSPQTPVVATCRP